MDEFPRINCLPPYVFSLVNEVKEEIRGQGVDIIDLGMGNPDNQPSPLIVESLVTALEDQHAHRYSLPRGIPLVREAICEWYARRYQIELDPKTEALFTLGSKEALAHLALALVSDGDTVIVQQPSYPIHSYSFKIAGADILPLSLLAPNKLIPNLKQLLENTQPRPKAITLNFPANPTGLCVDLAFFEEVIQLAKHHKVWVIHDFAYADITFQNNLPPSIMQVPGAKEVAVECYSLSKSYNVPGWRVACMVGNSTLVSALAKMKSYVDYGGFYPLQVAAATALLEDTSPPQTCAIYKERRDVLCEGLNEIGWPADPPEAGMFVWTKIPSCFNETDSLHFSKWLLRKTHVAVSPGIGFGDLGEGFVRFSLVESTTRLREAVQRLAEVL